MLTMLREAGFFGYLVTGVGLLALPASLFTWLRYRKAATPRRRTLLGVAWGVGALLILGLGVVGYLHGMRVVGAALVHVAPEMRDALLARGVLEARQNMVLGAIAAAAPLLFGALLVLSGRKRPGPGEGRP